MKYEIVVGLEVHVELSTKSKIFCSCTTEFGGDPNTHCCPVCTGMPGTLPVLNKNVVEYAIRAGLATNCAITRTTKFDRKNYFYPDLPKAYQISQLYLPICQNGGVEIQVGDEKKVIGIHEIHMEEDAGKLVHDPVEDCTLADYNRCGVPLWEIVSEPDFRSADEVMAYLEKLKATLQYIGVSDCKMQEGSLRADVNLSVRPAGTEQLGTRTEMKNMNSFKAIARAIQSEADRQISVLESGRQVSQETRRWDDNKGDSFAMRSKENAQDYRYFPEPDLPPVCISEEWIDRVKEELPELPDQKQRRYREQFGLPEYDTRMITATKAMADFFEATVELCGQPKEVANWIMGDIFRRLNENDTQPEDMTLKPEQLAKLIGLVEKSVINRNTAKSVFEAMFTQGVDPEVYVKEQGLEMVSDTGMVEAVIQKALEMNPQSVADYKGGKQKAFGFLVGQCMKELKGKADPQQINSLLHKALGDQ